QEGVVDGERAGVNVADRIDQAHHAACPAHVEPGQALPVPRKVEERVTREHVVPMCDQPVVQLALLDGGRVQRVPDVRATPRWPQPGDPQLRAEGVGDRLERVQLADILPSNHHRDLEASEAGRGEVAHRPQGRLERPGAADGVVDLRGGAVQGYLHVDVVTAGQPTGGLRRDLHAVGGEL